jgi:aspartokinase-like uncharacterized kinase
VTKIGGSLLSLADLPERLRRWRESRTNIHDILIVGGGALVDTLRALHNSRQFGDHAVHWAAIELMGVNARLLAAELPEFPLCRYGEQTASRSTQPGATFLDVVDFLHEIEPAAQGTKLPVGWETTSDAIAGRIAVVLEADELVLLKSTLPEREGTLSELAARGFIDPVLPRLEARLPPVTVHNLRMEIPAEAASAAGHPR